MPNTKKRTTQPQQLAREQSADQPIELVVRRGALRRYHALKRDTAELPVRVSWDRRTVERRGKTRKVQGERRKTDRRQRPPFTWELADFVVVGAPSTRDSVRGQTKE